MQGELKELARAVGQRKMNATRALLATQPLEEAERDLQERIGRAMVPHALAPFAGGPGEAWAAMSLEQHRAVVKGLMRVVIQPSRRCHIPGARPGAVLRQGRRGPGAARFARSHPLIDDGGAVWARHLETSKPAELALASA